MASTSKQLAQNTPANTTAVDLYSPASSTQVVGMVMVVCNTSTSTRKFSIYQDDDGTTKSAATALFQDVSIPGNTSQTHAIPPMNNSAGSIGIDTDGSSSELTFTLGGTEIT